MGTRAAYTVIELMIVVCIVAIISALAIPAFDRYMKRSKSAEADIMLRRLYDGSVTYFEAEFADPAGAILPSQFPVTTALTPEISRLGSSRAEVYESDWTAATWQALSFAVSDPTYYAFQYDSRGTENDSAFTASAFGNLDGDDEYSTFARVGTIDPHTEGIRGSPGVWQANELE